MAITIGNFVVPGLNLGALLNLAEGTWQLAAANAFASSFMVESLDGMVSGDYDLGDILAGATFSAVTAGLTEGIDFGFPEGYPFHDALLGFGSDQVTMAGLLETGLDGIIRSGLSSAVYGTDFGDGVLASVVSYVANGVAGALIEETADVFGHGAFSIEKLVAKATINCLAAEAGGASCASGAIGSLVTELVVTSGLNLGADDLQTYRERLQVIGAIAGYFASGGEADNVYATAFAALNDYDNNYYLGMTYAAQGISEDARAKCLAAGGSASQCDALARQVFEDFILGLSPDPAVVVDVILDFTPVVGDVKGVDECIADPSVLSCGGAAIGVVPLAGDAVKIVLKQGDKAVAVIKKADGTLEKVTVSADDLVRVEAAKGGRSGRKAAEKVTWVDEGAGMSDRAKAYDEGAMGSRSNAATQKGQAPALTKSNPDGTTSAVRFDGVDGDVLIDRKLSVVTTPKAKDQVVRQSEALSQNGLTGRWEVPTQSQANRATKNV